MQLQALSTRMNGQHFPFSSKIMICMHYVFPPFCALYWTFISLFCISSMTIFVFLNFFDIIRWITRVTSFLALSTVDADAKFLLYGINFYGLNMKRRYWAIAILWLLVRLYGRVNKGEKCYSYVKTLCCLSVVEPG